VCLGTGRGTGGSSGQAIRLELVDAADWVTLLVGIFAIAGTLGGVFIGAQLTHRSARDVLMAQLAEERRLELTTLLTDIAVDARGLVETAWIELPALGKMTLDDMLEYLNTDSGRENSERRRRLNENLTRALLLVGDHELAKRTAILAQHVRDWPEKAIGPVTEKKSGVRDIDAVLEGLGHVKVISRAVGDFELATRSVLAVAVQPSSAHSGLGFPMEGGTSAR
jgi:Kef-type K+ transport system membrane component KefB